MHIRVIEKLDEVLEEVDKRVASFGALAVRLREAREKVESKAAVERAVKAATTAKLATAALRSGDGAAAGDALRQFWGQDEGTLKGKRKAAAEGAAGEDDAADEEGEAGDDDGAGDDDDDDDDGADEEFQRRGKHRRKAAKKPKTEPDASGAVAVDVSWYPPLPPPAARPP